MLRIISTIGLLSFVILHSIASWSDNKVNIDNWAKHQEIVEVRNIYTKIKNGFSSGDVALLHRIHRFNRSKCRTYEKKLGLSNTARVLFYSETTLQGDSKVTSEYYYDWSSTLRFVYVVFDGSDSNSYRVYFDKMGRLLIALEKEHGKLSKMVDYSIESAVGGILEEKRALMAYRANSLCGDK